MSFHVTIGLAGIVLDDRVDPARAAGDTRRRRVVSKGRGQIPTVSALATVRRRPIDDERVLENLLNEHCRHSRINGKEHLVLLANTWRFQVRNNLKIGAFQAAANLDLHIKRTG